MHDREATSAADDDYRSRSARNWDAAAAGWESQRELVAAMARPLTDWLIDRLDVRAGLTVLEVGAGPGGIGLEIAPLVAPGGRVISSDRSPAMSAAARRAVAAARVENVEVRTLDVEAIDMADGSADRVVSRLAYMLVPDPGAALRETRRVLAPGGRLAFAVWDDAARNDWATVLWDVLEGLTDLPPARPGGPGMFALGDRALLERLVSGAGLELLALEPVEVEWRYPSFADYWRTQTALNGSLARLLPALAAAERAELERAVRAANERFRDGDGYRMTGAALAVAADAPEGV
jgi:SAM-dependent methyltransferase